MADDPANVEITIDDLKTDMSERGILEWELATLRATNRKLADMVRALSSNNGGNHGHSTERLGSLGEQNGTRS